jgi:hypothetical protein
MTVATLIIAGARHPFLEACRDLAEGKDDMGITRRPGAGLPIRLAIVADDYLALTCRCSRNLSTFEAFTSRKANRPQTLRQFLQAMVEQHR